MSLLHIVVLALVQGITEFLPISSSAHLILVPAVTGWSDQGAVLDIATHVGTLGAVVIYFRRDVWTMLLGCGQLVRGRRDGDARLALNVAVATIPALAAGLALVKLDLYPLLRSIEVIAWATLGFGLLLYAADRFAGTTRRLEEFGLAAAVFVGLMQALALIPGTSRAGITITAARLLGTNRSDAARFSMLLSIPTILAAGGYGSYELLAAGELTIGLDAALAALLSFVAALAAIWGLMRWVRQSSYTPFVVYRVLLAAVLFWWIYAG